MSYDLEVEKDRFFSRLATIPGIQPMPSVGDWILLHVEDPADLAKRVNRRMTPSPLSLPKGIDGVVRVHIGEPKHNEVVLQAIREVVKASRMPRFEET